jgi:hypothetical protein
MSDGDAAENNFPAAGFAVDPQFGPRHYNRQFIGRAANGELTGYFNLLPEYLNGCRIQNGVAFDAGLPATNPGPD